MSTATTNTDSSIDFDKIQKGDVITYRRLFAILGQPDDAYEFQRRLIAFSLHLQRELWKRDKPYTVRIRRFTLEILSDSEAVDYNANLFRHGLKKMAKSQRQLLAVDTGRFTADEIRDYQRTVTVQGAILAGALGARREIRRVAHKRTTPGLAVAH